MAVEAQAAVEVRKKLTPDDVWEMYCRGELPDTRWELIDGEVVELSGESGDNASIGANITAALVSFARTAGGKAFGASAEFRVGRERRQLRLADASYIGPERVVDSYPRWVDGAPDLAVEVLSRGQYGPAYARGKVREYFEADAQLVWLVDGRSKEVRVYLPNSDDYTIYRGEAELSLEPIISGFSLKVSDIFR